MRKTVYGARKPPGDPDIEMIERGGANRDAYLAGSRCWSVGNFSYPEMVDTARGGENAGAQRSGERDRP